MIGNAKAFQDLIAKLHKAIANYHEGLVRIDREFHAPKKALNVDQERNQEVRKSNWKLAFAKEWERNATEIASVSSQIRRHQPAVRRFW
jgi:S-DNA-T family DNA segregation ATPase FtsK/SpoIIIE